MTFNKNRRRFFVFLSVVLVGILAGLPVYGASENVDRQSDFRKQNPSQESVSSFSNPSREPYLPAKQTHASERRQQENSDALGAGGIQKNTLSDKASRASEKEVTRDLLENLVELQKRIDVAQSSLKNLGEQVRTPEPFQKIGQHAFVKTYVSLFVSCLEERSIEVQKGLRSLGKQITQLASFKVAEPVWLELGSVIFSMAGATLFALMVWFLAHLWVEKVMGAVFKWALAALSHRSGVQTMAGFVFEVLKKTFPAGLFFLVQVSAFFLVEPLPDLRSAMLSFSSGLFFWLFILKTQDVFWDFSTSFLRPSTRSMRFSFNRWLRFFLFFWIVNDWLITLFSFYQLPDEASTVVMLVFGLGMMLSSMAIVRLVRPVLWRWIKAAQEQQFPLLTTLFWVCWNTFPVGLYIVFLLDSLVYQKFFWAIVLTTTFLPMVPVLYVSLKRLRIMYLWSVRHDLNRSFLSRFLFAQRQSFAVIYVMTYSLVGIIIVELWDVRFLKYLRLMLGGGMYDQLADIAFISFIGWAAVHFGDRFLRNYLDKRSVHSGSNSLYLKGRMHTLMMTSRTALRISVFVTCFLVILSKIGYNITPIITNLGLFSVVLSFGLQSFVKDFFAGLFILLDNNVVVGDWVDIDGRLGVVEELSLRTIKARSDSGTLMTIPFGNIQVIGNRSRHFSSFLVNLSVPYDADLEKIQNLMEETYQKLRRSAAYRKKILAPFDLRGLNDMVSYAMVIQAKVRTTPTDQEFVRRGFNKTLKELLDAAGIKIPIPRYVNGIENVPSVSGKIQSGSLKTT